jgi:hypothetical protein
MPPGPLPSAPKASGVGIEKDIALIPAGGSREV